MAFTNEEKKVIFNDIITYSEYLEATEGKAFDESEKEYGDAQAPEGFHKIQQKAMNLFRKVVPQVQCLPRSRRDYLDLKEDMGIEKDTNIYHTEPMNYKFMFRDALAYQMGFMNDNQITFDNGGMNNINFGSGSYHQGAMSPINYNKIFRGLFPAAYDNLENMGGMNGCLNDHINTEIFYKGEQ